ncbi:unnamed protein product [Albugo candida]|uniref:PARP-type domain-containing protein n=1 Tax=Albugo candida TaxID=65357 RepID=A0A024FWH0_9STRA|nr:unnamed protein product [Albugo candida]|eukprot:CCI11282.1 unnamed protein product [Albugo candida]
MRAVSLLFFTAAGIIYKCDGTKDKCTNCTKKPANDVFVTSPTSETDAKNKQKIAVQLNDGACSNGRYNHWLCRWVFVREIRESEVLELLTFYRKMPDAG